MADTPLRIDKGFLSEQDSETAKLFFYFTYIYGLAMGQTDEIEPDSFRCSNRYYVWRPSVCIAPLACLAADRRVRTQAEATKATRLSLILQHQRQEDLVVVVAAANIALTV